MDPNDSQDVDAKNKVHVETPTAKIGAQQRISQVFASVRSRFSPKKSSVAKASTNPVDYLKRKAVQKSFASLAKPEVQIDDRKNDFKNGIDTLSKEDDPRSELSRTLNDTAVNLFVKPTQAPLPSDTQYTNFPDADVVFRDILQAKGRPKENEHGTSSMTYAVGALLSLSLSRATPNDNLSDDSLYLDLSPLYGSSESEEATVRVKEGYGMLAPDCFHDHRTALLPRSVAVILILLNRNHNYIARYLFLSDNGNRWIDPSTQDASPLPAKLLSQDDEIFQKARMINCAHFRNIIMCDFMKGLLGLPTVGPRSGLNILADVNGREKGKGVNSSVVSSFLYNFSHLMSETDVQSFGEAVESAGKSPEHMSSADYEEVVDVLCNQADHNPRRRDHANLPRGHNSYFKDDDLAEVLYEATGTPSIAPGSGVPASMKPIHLKAIERARARNVCSLNSYRKYLGLKPYTSFLEWNPNSEVARAAEKLYGDINKLELYPGLQAEEVPRGSGFGLGYTASYALLVDLTYRIRNDPKLTTELNERNITHWGVDDCDPQKHIGCGTGAMLPRLFQRTLPRNYPYDNLYTLFPFITPSAAVKALPKWKEIVYTTGKPQKSSIVTVKSRDTISYIFNNPKIYHTPYGPDLKLLTRGYGFFLGFDDEKIHDQEQMMMLYALIPDDGALARYAKTFNKLVTEYIQDWSSYRGSNANSSTIDIIRDVINPVCTRWVCETLCDYKLSKDLHKRRAEETSLHEKLAALYIFVFRNMESEGGWELRERAMEYSTELQDVISKNIPTLDEHKDDHYGDFLKKYITGLYSFGIRVFNELIGIPLPDETAQTFLKRLVRANRNISLEKSYTPDELTKLFPNMYKAADPKGEMAANEYGFSAANIFKLARALISPSNYYQGCVQAIYYLAKLPFRMVGITSDPKREMTFDERRIVANILGLAVVTAVNYSQVCAQAVNYYLAPEHSDQLKEIVELCNTKHPKAHDNAVLMGFIREAQISDQKLGLWRNVAAEDKLPQNEVKVYPGDRVYADITAAHKHLLPIVSWTINEKGEKKYKVQPVPTIQGMGLHKCAGMTFVDQTMPEIFRAIFQLPGIRSASRDGQLVKINPLLDLNETTPVSFLNPDHTVAYYPKNLVIEYDGKSEDSMRKKREDRYKVDPGSATKNIRRIMNVILPLILIFFVLAILAWLGLLVRNQARNIRKRLSDRDVQQISVDCPSPMTPIHPWQSNTFNADIDGHPIPIEYTLDLPVAHRLSFVDVDKKDVRMSVEIDDILRGFARDFELNKTEDCGENVGLCLEKRFSAGMVVVPPGKHAVRIAWQGKENLPEEWGNEKFRRIYWYREMCRAK